MSKDVGKFLKSLGTKRQKMALSSYYNHFVILT